HPLSALTAGCQRPSWVSILRLEPDQENYKKNEKVKLSCPEGFQPTYTEIRCQNGRQHYDDDVTPYSVYQPFWHGRDSRGAWVPIQSSLECIEGCQRLPLDSRLRLEPDQENYKKNEKVKLSCPEGFQPTYTKIKCQSGLQHYDDDVTPYSVYQPFWHGRDPSGAWVPIQSSLECIALTAGCQRPSWVSILRLEPDQENYKKNEKVKLSCPEGFQPTYTEIKCQSGRQHYDDDVTPYSVYQPFWHGRDSRGAWVLIQSSLECIGKGGIRS
uniref:Sushi domain-containing protein n=1 Tax=Catharus ustulatus TaxID=91951 RepID=A0A8C3Y6X4_CATUS